jgi:hypothetical protein
MIKDSRRNFQQSTTFMDKEQATTIISTAEGILKTTSNVLSATTLPPTLQIGANNAEKTGDK